MATKQNEATKAMLTTVGKMLDCWDYGEEKWDEEFLKTIQKYSKRGGNWAKQWYLDDIKEDGGFDFSGVSCSYHFAEWAAKDALKQVDWEFIGRNILEEIGNG